MKSLFLKLAAFVFLLCGGLWVDMGVSAEPIQAMIPAPQKNSAEVALGKLLFHSKLLSSDNTISCASCHKLDEGGDDNVAFSVGIANRVGKINSPSVFNSALDISQFWDGRADSLVSQIEGPIHDPREMGSNWDQIIKKLSDDKALVEAFYSVYGDGINESNIKSAIATYESQLVTLDAPFDKFLSGNDYAISDMAKEGYRLFKSMGCISCHQGRNVGGNMYQHFGVMGNYFEDRGNIVKADYGRFNVTGREVDRFKFKVPSLRNVEHTAPYFHDGAAASLEEAIKIMAKYQLGRPIDDRQAYVIGEFLKSLTGSINPELMP